MFINSSISSIIFLEIIQIKNMEYLWPTTAGNIAVNKIISAIYPSDLTENCIANKDNLLNVRNKAVMTLHVLCTLSLFNSHNSSSKYCHL